MTEAASASALPRSGGERAAASAPALLHLSDALPSSLAQLGLSFSPAAPFAHALPTTSTNAAAGSDFGAARSAAAPPPATPSPSFRVRAIHFDDVAQDAILVCENSITLFVPLHCAPSKLQSSLLLPAATSGKEGCFRAASSSMPNTAPSTCAPSPQPHTPQPQQTHSPTVPAVAACLRLGNAHQAWSPAQPSSTAHAVSERCLPRRLPLSPEQLRRASSVLIAVPVLALPSSVASAAAAATADKSSYSGGGQSEREESTVMSIVIVECAVLPEGVDFIEPGAIPLARPLQKILCTPNTLRFREAWYPLHLCCWCGPAETLRCGTRDAASPGQEGGGSATDAAQPYPPYTDYYMLCVSAICVDLLRIRHHRPSVLYQLTHQGHCSEVSPVHTPDVPVMMDTGHAAAVQPSSPLFRQWQRPSATTSASSATPVNGEVVVTVVQRYVTRTDWCVYESHSRVLLSVNYNRPGVLKPVAVHFDAFECAAPAAHGGSESPTRRSEAVTTSAAAASASSVDSTFSFPCVAVSLSRWAELTLPESLCSSILLHSAVTTLPSDARVARLLPSVVGICTLYGLPFVFHVPASHTRTRGTPCMDLYLYHPDDTRTSAATADGDGEGAAPSSPTTFSYNQGGSATATTDLRHTGHDGTIPGNSGSCGGSHPLPASTSAGFFKRWTAAASAASASAAPPHLRGGRFIHVAQLSLRELLPPSPSYSASVSPLSTYRGSGSSSSSSSTRGGNGGGGGGGSSRGQVDPRLPTLSVQVSSNFLLVHHLRTGRTAIFDLAERTSERVATTTTGAGQLTTRDYVLWAVASDRSRSWIRTHHPTTVAPFLSSPGGLHANAAGAAAQRRGTATTTASSTAYTNGSDQLWSRAAGGDWMSMLSAVTGSVLEFSAAVDTITSGAADSSATAAGAATASALRESVPQVLPLCCCAATVSLEKANDAGWEREDLDTLRRTSEVLYISCVWPSSSRASLVIDKRDGSLRLCQVDAAALAEWLLVLRTSHASPASRRTGGGATATGSAAAASAAPPAVVSSASFSQLMAFAYRHPHRMTQQAKDEASSSCGSNDDVEALVALLGDMAEKLVVGSEEGVSWVLHARDASSFSPQHSTTSPYRSIGERYLPSVATAAAAAGSSAVVFAHWSAMLEGLVLETEVLDRLAASSRQRMLSSVLGGGVKPTIIAAVPHPISSSPSSAALGHHTAPRGRGAALQLSVVLHVWKPMWHVLKQHHHHLVKEERNDRSGQQQQQKRHHLSRQLQRCEMLMCAHVRLLRRLAISVLPALQELLLEVVLRCDLDTGSIMVEEEDNAVQASSPSSRSVGGSLSVFMASTGRSARRVRDLLRQGVLESSCTTARSLLGWWERFRYQLAAMQQEACARAKEVSSPCNDMGAETAKEADMLAQAATRASAASSYGFFCDVGCPEAEALFQEAVRLFELHGQQLEVAEAYRWRHDYAKAATILLRVPRDTPPIEVCEVHGTRRSRQSSQASATGDGSSSSSFSSAAASTSAPQSVRAAPQHTSRLLTWDTLAVAVLDGAWKAVRTAEEGCYVLVERAAAVARSEHTPSSPVAYHSPSSPSALIHAPPPLWQLRAAKQAVQVAHRVYLSVATTIFSAPGLSSVGGAPSSSSSSFAAIMTHAAAAAAAAESTTEFHPTAVANSIHSSHQRFNPVSSNVSAGYYAHEARFLQLRQQVELDWQQMMSVTEV